jgi:catechol 2,3-dioxygenase-like lactoylglutathione lyase family enzyme
MPAAVRFAHVNLVAQDWRRLIDFYVTIFGCRPVPPERHMTGEWLERGTGVTGARIDGMHLRLPGFDAENGPTLEIFSYQPAGERLPGVAANRPGFGHLAFLVENIAETRDRILAAGGGSVGEIITREISGVGVRSFCYVTDPEGNIIELQRAG